MSWGRDKNQDTDQGKTSSTTTTTTTTTTTLVFCGGSRQQRSGDMDQETKYEGEAGKQELILLLQRKRAILLDGMVSGADQEAGEDG